jgi:hypothetical protein
MLTPIMLSIVHELEGVALNSDNPGTGRVRSAAANLLQHPPLAPMDWNADFAGLLPS